MNILYSYSYSNTYVMYIFGSLNTDYATSQLLFVFRSTMLLSVIFNAVCHSLLLISLGYVTIDLKNKHCLLRRAYISI